MDVISRKPFSYLGIISILAVAANTISNIESKRFLALEFEPIEIFIIIASVFTLLILIRCLVYRDYIVKKAEELIIHDIFYDKKIKVSEVKEVKYPDYPWQGTKLITDHGVIKIDTYNLNKRDCQLLDSWIT